MSDSDITAVHRTLAELIEARNTGDAESFARCFTEEADHVAANGGHSHGRGAILAAHRALFAGPLRGSHLVGYGPGSQLRRLSAEVVLVVAEGALRLPDGPPAPRRSRTLTVLTRVGERWLIAGFQHTPIVDFGGR